MIVASSSSVYGANPTLPKHEDLAPAPLSPYAASKLATESYALAYQHSFGLPVAGLPVLQRVRAVAAGRARLRRGGPRLRSRRARGAPLAVHGDGHQTRDFTFVDTVAAVLTAAATRRVTSDRPVNLAYGTRTDLLTLVRRLEEVVGHPLEVEHLEPRPGDVRHSQADNSRLVELFGDIEPVDLRDGLEATVAWMASRPGS